MPAQPESMKAPEYAQLDTAALAVLLRGGAQLVLLDARGDDAEETIPGSVPLSIKSTASDVEEAVGDKDSLLVTFCTNLHCPLSGELFELLKNMDYENVIDYPDGLAGWKAAGYPVAKRS